MNNHALKIVNDYIQFSDRTMILQHANMNLSLFKSSSSKEKRADLFRFRFACLGSG